MATVSKFNDYSLQKNKAKHDWSAHTFKVVLSNTLPTAANAVLADIVAITAGNGYAAGGPALAGVTCTGSAGTTTVQANQVTITATGGSIGPFRYYAVYNDTQTTPAKPLVLWWDHGSAVTLADGESFTIKFNNASPGTIFTDS